MYRNRQKVIEGIQKEAIKQEEDEIEDEDPPDHQQYDHEQDEENYQTGAQDHGKYNLGAFRVFLQL